MAVATSARDVNDHMIPKIGPSSGNSGVKIGVNIFEDSQKLLMNWRQKLIIYVKNIFVTIAIQSNGLCKTKQYKIYLSIFLREATRVNSRLVSLIFISEKTSTGLIPKKKVEYVSEKY